MKTIEEPSSYFKWNGELCQVVGIADGKQIIFRRVGGEPCPKCGEKIEMEHSVVERSPLFQECAEKINTIKEPSPQGTPKD